MAAQWPLSYREGQFAPVEAAVIAGLSLTLQRDWRSQGHLRPRTSARARFSPRELAEMRIMVALRSLGLSLPTARTLAQQGAPSVLFIALSEHSDTLAVDPPEHRERYLEGLERQTDGAWLNLLSGLEGAPYFYVLTQGKHGELRYNLDNPRMDTPNPDKRTEASGFVTLEALTANLAEAAGKTPLFTLTAPPGFR